MDTLTKIHRSWNMSRIREKNTLPERTVKKSLHFMNYKAKAHMRSIQGHPDFFLKDYNTAIFVHGCFWHRHKGCKFAYTPKSRTVFWKEKFKRNILRDRTVARLLRKAGIARITIWECQTKDAEKLRLRLARLLARTPSLLSAKGHAVS